MASEIEEIGGTDSTPRYGNTHNDSYRHSDINGNSNGDGRGEDNKKDGRKGTLTRVLCYPLRLARSGITNRRSEKDDIKSEHGGNSRANRPEPDFDANLSFLPESQYKDFRARFKALGPRKMKCLSSFILFPEDTVVKKRLLVHWWIGEGLLDDLKGKTLEESATQTLDEFESKHFILPVYKSCPKEKNSFKMHPHVRSTIILHAKSLCSRSDHGNSLSWVLDRARLVKSKPLKLEHLETVNTLFNVSKGSLDFKLELFSKMRDVNVLYLRRWQNSAEHHHVEVTGTEFLKGFKYMKNLRFLSLQGISGIQELPSPISNLTSLMFLDLRACYNLEKLPKEIDSLKKLTYLDISECYLLDCMPKQLLSLSELQVLKGFLITDTKNKSSSSLGDLAKLKNLKKLSVNLNSQTFSIDKFSAVLKFKELVKLKITWGRKVSNVKRNKKSKQENKEVKSEKLEELRSSGSKLEKLELQCLPHIALPNWVTPENLTSLKKLYIRGGGLKSLGRIQEGKPWTVQVLRLRYLKEFKMDWRELTELFLHLQYLEKFKCPKVTLVPCDYNGVWKSSRNESAPPPQTTS